MVASRNLVNSRNNDRKRAKEYKKELEEMKKRIQTRPYLFEQVTKVIQTLNSFLPWVNGFLRVVKRFYSVIIFLKLRYSKLNSMVVNLFYLIVLNDPEN